MWESAGRPQAGALHDVMRHTNNQYRHAARRLRRAGDKLQNDIFVQSLTAGGANLFEEIKKFRGTPKNVSSVIDGETGAKNIANKFADIYSDLYSKVENGEELINLRDQINNEINEDSLEYVNKIDDNLMKEALAKMKNGKSDVLYNFSSDCLTNCPPDLVPHLVNMCLLCTRMCTILSTSVYARTNSEGQSR